MVKWLGGFIQAINISGSNLPPHPNSGKNQPASGCAASRLIVLTNSRIIFKNSINA